MPCYTKFRWLIFHTQPSFQPQSVNILSRLTDSRGKTAASTRTHTHTHAHTHTHTHTRARANVFLMHERIFSPTLCFSCSMPGLCGSFWRCVNYDGYVMEYEIVVQDCACAGTAVYKHRAQYVAQSLVSGSSTPTYSEDLPILVAYEIKQCR